VVRAGRRRTAPRLTTCGAVSERHAYAAFGGLRCRWRRVLLVAGLPCPTDG
jgi:hypothetical protein